MITRPFEMALTECGTSAGTIATSPGSAKCACPAMMISTTCNAGAIHRTFVHEREPRVRYSGALSRKQTVRCRPQAATLIHSPAARAADSGEVRAAIPPSLPALLRRPAVLLGRLPRLAAILVDLQEGRRWCLSRCVRACSGRL